MMKNLPFHKRLANALQGLLHALRHERSLRFHALGAITVFAAILILRPGYLWSAILTLTVGTVLTAELFNTALETLVDHLHPEHHEKIRIVKDCAAAAVLLAAMMAVGVALAFTLTFFTD